MHSMSATRESARWQSLICVSDFEQVCSGWTDVTRNYADIDDLIVAWVVAFDQMTEIHSFEVKSQSIPMRDKFHNTVVILSVLIVKFVKCGTQVKRLCLNGYTYMYIRRKQKEEQNSLRVNAVLSFIHLRFFSGWRLSVTEGRLLTGGVWSRGFWPGF